MALTQQRRLFAANLRLASLFSACMRRKTIWSERCRLVFQPLATFPATSPAYITISSDKVDKAALKAAMLRELF